MAYEEPTFPRNPANLLTEKYFTSKSLFLKDLEKIPDKFPLSL